MNFYDKNYLIFWKINLSTHTQSEKGTDKQFNLKKVFTQKEGKKDREIVL